MDIQKKVLFVANVSSHIKGFHEPYLKIFKDKGYITFVATKNNLKNNDKINYCDKFIEFSIERNPFKLKNINAIRELKGIIEKEKFDIIHCHTPMGGVVARIAAKCARKEYGTKVLYTGHGFHFYKGAPLKNWIFFYPIELYLSKYTDAIITINKEDYELSKKHFKAKKNYMIHGVGVDDKRFNEHPLEQGEEEKLFNELKIKENDFKIFYVAELIKRKNQLLLIEAMKDVVLKNPNIKVFLVGNGKLMDYYNRKIEEYNLDKNVFMLGFRKDVDKLLKIADLCVSSSSQEGLGINLIEAALSGVPLLASKIRGHNEIIIENKNGFFFSNKNELIDKILMLSSDKTCYNELKKNARNSVKNFVLDESVEFMRRVYNEFE